MQTSHLPCTWVKSRKVRCSQAYMMNSVYIRMDIRTEKLLFHMHHTPLSRSRSSGDLQQRYGRRQRTDGEDLISQVTACRVSVAPLRATFARSKVCVEATISVPAYIFRVAAVLPARRGWVSRCALRGIVACVPEASPLSPGRSGGHTPPLARRIKCYVRGPAF